MGNPIELAWQQAMPHLFLVSINGADECDMKRMVWDRLIQALERVDSSLNEWRRGWTYLE